MLVQVVGIRHNKGEYNGKAYDNYKLSCLLEDSHTDGWAVKDLTISLDILNTFLGVNQYKTPHDLLDKNLDVLFNEYGKVALINKHVGK